jgi:hypothetical protein
MRRYSVAGIFSVTVFLVCIIFPSSASASTILATPDNTGLVGYWSLDASTINWATGVVRDLSGKGNNGHVINMSTTTSPVQGILNQALKFNGTNQYISEGTSISTIQSIAFWAKAATGASQGLINLTGSTVYISTNSSNVLSGTGFTSPTYYIDGVASTTPGLYDANWHQVVIKSTATITGSQLEIGRANSVYFSGTIDEVRIYNRALTAAQVATLYNASKATHVDSGNTVTLATGLVGYWPLDGSTINWATGIVRDLSGQNNNGSLINMSTSTSPVQGKIGQALKFNGSDYINMGNVLNMGTNSWTASAWVKYTGASLYGIVDKSLYGPGNGRWGMILNDGGSNTECITEWVGGAVINVKGPSEKDGKWHLITCTWNRTGNETIYVDGISKAALFIAAYSGGNMTNSYQACIAAYQNGSGNCSNASDPYFPGTIDDVRIYNRALSAGEVKQLYALGSANVAHSNTVTLSTGLVGYWPLDGNTTSWKTDTTLDMSGHNNTGQLINMSTSTSPAQGKIGQALKFNGVSSYITTLAHTNTLISPSTGSVSVWVKPTGASPTGAHAYATEEIIADTTANFGFFRGTVGGLDRLWVQNYSTVSSQGEVKIGVTYTNNQWTHLVWVHSGGILYAYANGVFVSSTAANDSAFGNNYLRIGYGGSSPTYFQAPSTTCASTTGRCRLRR